MAVVSDSPEPTVWEQLVKSRVFEPEFEPELEPEKDVVPTSTPQRPNAITPEDLLRLKWGVQRKKSRKRMNES